MEQHQIQTRLLNTRNQQKERKRKGETERENMLLPPRLFFPGLLFQTRELRKEQGRKKEKESEKNNFYGTKSRYFSQAQQQAEQFQNE